MVVILTGKYEISMEASQISVKEDEREILYIPRGNLWSQFVCEIGDNLFSLNTLVEKYLEKQETKA